VRKQTYRWLLVIFVLGAALRLLYFPGNVYFGNDQGRDAYYSYEVMGGNWKVVGPGATFGKFLHHGVAYYYLMGPIYALAQGSPFLPAIVINFLSMLGILVVFGIARDLFDEKTGFFAALLYAVSFEQSQYAMFFGHPGMALVFVLLYYWGLMRLIFKEDRWGIILAAFCAGMATQFHISLIILVLMLPVWVVIYRKRVRNVLKKVDVFWALVALGVSLSSFVVAEMKFRHLRLFLASLGERGTATVGVNTKNLLFAVNRYVGDNLSVFPNKTLISLLLVMLIFGLLIRQKREREKGLFLVIWFLVGLVAYGVGDSTSYYYGIGGSVSLLIAAAVLIGGIWKRKRALAVVLLAGVIVSNVWQIVKVNAKGPIGSIMAPTGLLLTDELAAVDYIYTQAGQEEFSVHAITIPYNVKTTWDYLFNWYGKKKYGFVPVWGGEDALGSEGTMVVVRERSTLPGKQFLIVEPLAGLERKIVEDFFREEDYFTHLVSEKSFGDIKVQVREKY